MGPVTSHWTRATPAITRNTAIGARRRNTRGKVSAATNETFGVSPVSKIQPEKMRHRAPASAPSTAEA